MSSFTRIGKREVQDLPGHNIQDEGISLSQRANLNFIGGNVVASDNAGNDATDITISGGTPDPNSVGLTELASGTTGELYTWDTLGDPTTVSVGNSGEVLTSNGSGSEPTFSTISVSSLSTGTENDLITWNSLGNPITINIDANSLEVSASNLQVNLVDTSIAKSASGLEVRSTQATPQSAGTGTVTLDYSNGDWFPVTATGNITIAISNLPSSRFTVLMLEAINFGGYTITWPTTKWEGGTAPTLTTTGTDHIMFYRDGDDVLYGVLVALDIK